MQRNALYWTAPAAYMLLILGLSSIPGIPAETRDPIPLGSLIPLVSNFLHLPLYAGLAVTVCLPLVRCARLRLPVAAVVAVVAASLFGVADEAYQSLTVGRTSSLSDVVTNFVGATIGAALFLVAEVRRRAQAVHSV